MTYYPLRWTFLIILGLLVYGQTFQYGFVFDDQYFIVNNPYIRSLGHVHMMWQVFPVTRLIGMYSFALNYYFNQLNPQGYHIFNFIVHLVATGLVWALAGLLIRKELAFFIAVLFLVHPCQTQAVTYITQRFESMATVFYLSTMYFYLRARISTDKIQRAILFGLAGASIILGILTKEVIVTVPVMILAAEWILFPQRNNKKLYTALAVAGIFLVAVLSKMLHARIGTFLHAAIPSESHDGDILTPMHYVLTQMRVFLTFLRLLVLPIHQNLDYDYPASSGLLHPPLTLVGLGVIFGLVFLIIKLRRKTPLIAFGLAWVLITFSINLAPRSNVIFEHKLYLISFGFFLAVAAALSIWIKNHKTLMMILWCLIAIFAALSFHRNKIWRNDLILWDETVQESPLKARPLNNRGLAYFHLGKFAQAMEDYNKAIAINPEYSGAYNNRGLLYFKQGNFNLAISDFNQSIEKNTESASAYSSYSNRGLAYFHQGNFSQAMLDYNKAIEINPYFADAYSNRGLLYYNQKEFKQAILDYSKAIELNPNVSDEYNNRGTCYIHLGNYINALADYNKAVEIDPDNLEAHKNRSLLNTVILSAAKNLKIP
jgi:tetratricopeptide (TPR) repeat protein